MLKLPLEDFIFEVKEEIKCYEELGEEKAEQWEKNFNKWLNDKKTNKNKIKYISRKKFYVIKDESEIFSIVDKFYDAVIQNKTDEYWRKF